MNCLGVLVNVDDHTLLSRVNIFYTLEELIESTLCGNSDRTGVDDADVDGDGDGDVDMESNAFNSSSSNKGSSTVHLSRSLSQSLPNPTFTSTLYPCPPPPSPSAKGLQYLTRAAMKLFIFLALQVATSGEREMSYIVSKFVAISLKRARSGKNSTDILYLFEIGTAVFWMVYASLVLSISKIFFDYFSLSHYFSFSFLLFFPPSFLLIFSLPLFLIRFEIFLPML